MCFGYFCCDFIMQVMIVLQGCVDEVVCQVGFGGVEVEKVMKVVQLVYDLVVFMEWVRVN